MTVKEFIEKYNNAKNKEEFMSKCIGRQYVPYEEKIARCKNIADNTMYVKTKIDGVDNEFFSINTPARYVMHTLTLIDLYTNIEINFKNTLENFNDLDSSGLIPCIMDIIPQNELARFSQVLDWTISDKMENERSLVSFLENKFTAFEMASNIMSNAFAETVNE